MRPQIPQWVSRRVAERWMFSTIHRRRRQRSMTELAASEFNCQVLVGYVIVRVFHAGEENRTSFLRSR